METNKQIKHFRTLPPHKILAEVGKWGDYELLDVLDYFYDNDKRGQAAAVLEIILRSPEHSDMVAYDQLYDSLSEYYHLQGDFPNALRWRYAAIAYDEQHESGVNRSDKLYDLIETYLAAADFDTALTLSARLLEIMPGDVWLHNRLGMTLPQAGLPTLAVTILDRALELTAAQDPYNLHMQLADLQKDAQQKAAGATDRSADINPDLLTALRAVLQIPVPPEQQDVMPYLPPLNRVLAAGVAWDKGVYAEILAQGRILAPDLIRLSFAEEWRKTAVAQHAITLLRQLLPTMPELSELTHWLERANGDWHIELLAKAIGKIGGYTTAELIEFVTNPGYHLYIRTAASDTLVARVTQFPHQRDEIVQVYRTLLTRPEAYTAQEETFIGFLISDVTDMKARELYEEVKQAFAEDRVDASIIDFAYVHQKWGLNPLPRPSMRSDGLYLDLRCKVCARARRHFVQHVIVDANTLEKEKEEKGLSTRYSAHIMDREIVCPKCGAVDQYEMTPMASLRLYMPTDLDNVQQMLNEKRAAKPKPNPYLIGIRSMAFGQPMHPLEALDAYREKIQANPKDAQLHLRLGNLLRTLRRQASALATFQQAYALAPDNAEICLACGMAHHDFGDRAVAEMMYNKALTLSSPWQVLRRGRAADVARGALEGLRLLKRKEPSPHQIPIANEVERPLPTPAHQPGKKKQSKKKRRR